MKYDMSVQIARVTLCAVLAADVPDSGDCWPDAVTKSRVGRYTDPYGILKSLDCGILVPDLFQATAWTQPSRRSLGSSSGKRCRRLSRPSTRSAHLLQHCHHFLLLGMRLYLLESRQ
jgi:hypothetical protein